MSFSNLSETLHNKSWMQARVEEGLTGTQIATLIGCSPAAVSNSLSRLGIESWRASISSKLKDRELLQRLYVTEARNAAQLAELIGCDKSNVLKALRKHGIEIKDSSEAQKVRTSSHGSSAPRPRHKYLETLQDPEWLRARIDEGLNVTDIAKLAKCAGPSVTQALAKYGIKYTPPPSKTPILPDPNVYRGRRKIANSRQSFWHQARRITPASNCAVCKTQPGSDVNHKDRNPANNDPSNLERLCRKCHRGQHTAEAEIMWAMLKDRGVQYIEVHRQGRAALFAGILADQKEEADALQDQVSHAKDDPDYSLVMEDDEEEDD